MKKNVFFVLAACLLASCSSNDDNVFDGSPVETRVSITFSPYKQEAMTRAASPIADIATYLDVWLYESGSEAAAFHQSVSDADFGSINVTLDKTKTYTLYAVAHKATGAATLTDGVITFPDDKVTHAMYYTTTFSPATTTNLSCLMNRIVAQFRLETTDAVPDGVVKMRFTMEDVFDRWNVTTGGTHQVSRVTTFENFTKKGDGTAAFTVYAIVTDAETAHNITIEALDSNDDVIQSRYFENVPLRNNYKTTYRGTFFTDQAATATFTVDDWSEYDVVNF